MRGLLIALLAIDFPGHDVNRRAGRERAPLLTKTMAKTTTKTV